MSKRAELIARLKERLAKLRLARKEGRLKPVGTGVSVVTNTGEVWLDVDQDTLDYLQGKSECH